MGTKKKKNAKANQFQSPTTKALREVFKRLDGVIVPFQKNHQWDNTECLCLAQGNSSRTKEYLSLQASLKGLWKRKKNVTQWQAKCLK